MRARLLFSLAVLIAVGVTTAPVNAQDTDRLLTGEELGLPELQITVTDEGWDFPDSVEAGRYFITATYDGDEEFGTAAFVRLPEGWSVTDLAGMFEAASSDALPNASDGTDVDFADESVADWLYWFSFAGGVSAAAGETAQGVIDLYPGSWAIWADNTDKAPQPLTVTGPMPADLLDPESNVTLTHANDGDSYSLEIDGDVQAGLNVIRIENVSDAPHLVEFIGLSHPLSTEQMLALIQTPDGQPVDSATDLPADFQLEFSSLYAATQSSGTVQWLIGSFEPGSVVAACWIPNAEDPEHTHAESGEFVLVEVV